MTRRTITDEALVAFVLWCRSNNARLVTNPALARRVFDAYRLMRPTSDEQSEAS